MNLARWKKHRQDFERNGRWGTCSGCTYDDPAKCADTDRYDHHFDATSLAGQLERLLKRREEQ